MASSAGSFDPLRELVLPKLEGIRQSGGSFSARCPAHDDRNPSLSVSAGKDHPVVFHCQAGCDQEAILNALGLTWDDLCKPRDNDSIRATVVATYEYTDEHGVVLFVKERRLPKDFRVRVPDGWGGWSWKLGDTRRVLYRLPQVLTAIKAGKSVYLVEGEKDVHAAEKAGAVATCNFDGAAKSGHRPKWRREYGDMLRGAHVIIVADNDEAGRAHATAAAEDLADKAASVKVVRGLVDDEHADLSDHLAAGHSLDQLVPVDGGSAVLVAIPASSMRMRAPIWVRTMRIPAGAITLLGGREGIGKSTIAYDQGARITRGDLEGQYEGTPKSIGVVATEDDWETVILPRLVAARADRTRVYRIEARTEEGEYQTISVPAHLDALTQVCRQYEIVMLIIDPIMSVLAGTLDTHKDREVRRALDPLNRFAAESGVAILALIHVNKSSGSDPLNSIMASRAFTAVARSVLYCILDPEDEEEDRYLFGHPKSNLGPKQPSIGYRIRGSKVETEDGTTISTSYVLWGNEDSRSIREAMETERPSRKAGETATGLVDWITEQGRAVAVKEIAEAFPNINTATLNTNLSRLVKRGELTRPVWGHYASPPKRGRGEGGGRSDTDTGVRQNVTSVTSVSSGAESDTRIPLRDRSDTYDTSYMKDVSREGVRTTGTPPTVTHTNGHNADAPPPKSGTPNVFGPGEYAAAGFPGLYIPDGICRQCGHPGGSEQHRHACADRVAAVANGATVARHAENCPNCQSGYDTQWHAIHCPNGTGGTA